MKNINVLCISDNRLTVYVCGSREVRRFGNYDFSDQSDSRRFLEQVNFFKGRKNYVLLDVSVEDYHLEQLPHVRGTDRKRLLTRKLEKYFPDSDYCYSELAKRLKVGRRDDIYAFSGIADSSAIDPVIDAIANNDIDISGVYSLPLLTKTLISPLIHDDQVLVFSCEEQGGRYSFRQTFVDNGHLYFSRQTSISSSVDLAVDQFRKEIDRTWQYLNNKRVLAAKDRMQLILLIPDDFRKRLRNVAVAPHSEYLFVDLVELASNHGWCADKRLINIPAMASFLLAKKAPKTVHYHPKGLTFFHQHQKINRCLRNASLIVVLAVILLTAMNYRGYQRAAVQGESLIQAQKKAMDALALHEVSTTSGEASPQKLQSLVHAYKSVSSAGSSPDVIFSILSKSFANYSDLKISDIEWSIKAVEQDGKPSINDSMDDYSINGELSPTGITGTFIHDSTKQALSTRQDIVLNIEGSVRNFKGDYRRSINRIKSLSSHLDAQNSVKNVLVTKLPLNIDSSSKTSRTLSSALIPDFSIRVTLNARELTNAY